MKKFALAMTVISATALSACGGSEQQPEASAQQESTLNLDSLDSKVSYLLGFNSIEQFKAQRLEIDVAAFTAGIAAAAEGSEPAISPDQSQAIFAEYQAKMQAAAQAEFDKAAADNLQRSQAFLAGNAAKDGVVTTESGLQYRVLELGEGEKPSAESTVQVHYEGRLITGDVFDSSIARGAPVEFGLNQVIPGWTEGLQLMSEGAKYEFYIPSDLAYGSSGSNSIGPNEALIFVVELVQANYEPDAESSAD